MAAQFVTTTDRTRFEALMTAAMAGGCTIPEALKRAAIAVVSTADGTKVNPAKAYGATEFDDASPSLQFSETSVTVSVSTIFGIGFIEEYGE